MALLLDKRHDFLENWNFASSREVRIQNEDGSVSMNQGKRTYDSKKSKGQGRMIRRQYSASVPLKEFDYNARWNSSIPLRTPLLLPPIKEQMLTRYIKADDIVLKILVHSKLTQAKEEPTQDK